MGASPSANKAGLGWLVLAAALAVPGFLFFNWWSHMKADRDRSVAVKARGRLPDGAVFQTPPSMPRPSNPVVEPSAPVAPAAPAAQASAPAPLPVESVAAPVPVEPAAAPPAPAFVSAASASQPARVVLSRDPMLSPMDIVRLREEELARERSRRELELANRRRQPVAKGEPPIEKRIELQGTVAAGGVSLAIVNNATMSLGDSFSVAGYAAKVRIIKISAVGVTFEYKKRRFTKTVSQE